MKCPYRVNEVHLCNAETYIYKEFGECYGMLCPYWGIISYSPCDEHYGCRKAETEC